METKELTPEQIAALKVSLPAEAVHPRTSLAAKLVKAMAAIGTVEKRGVNTKQNYKYVKATDIANEVRAALIAQGVAFTLDVESEDRWEKPTANGGTLFFCSLKVRGDFHDSETGEIISGRAIGWGADSLDKAPYKAMTGALKYILRMNFLIPDEEDPEQDNDHQVKHTHPAGKASAPATKPTPASADPKPSQAQDGPINRPWEKSGDRLACYVESVQKRTSATGKNAGKPFLIVTVNRKLANGKDILFCWDSALFDAFSEARRKPVLLEIEEGEFNSIKDLVMIEGVTYRSGKPFRENDHSEDGDPLLITDDDLPEPFL